MLLGGFDDHIAIEIPGRLSQIDSEWGTQCVLRAGIRVRVDSRSLDSILRGGPSDASDTRQCILREESVVITDRAISPRFAMRMESSGFVGAEIEPMEAAHCRVKTF